MIRRARTLGIASLLVAVAGPGLAAPPPGVTGPALRSTATVAQADRFLGFAIGEELRYVLGPPESLVRGESGMWSIRLDEVYAGDDGSPEGVFALRHEWQAPQPIGDPPLRTIMRVVSEGTLRTNAHGFPLAIRYQTVRHLAGMGDEAYTIEYELDEDQRGYQKRTTRDGDRWYLRVPIRGDDTIHRDPPSGLFAFLPAAPGCMDRLVANYELASPAPPQPRSAATPAGVQPPSKTVRVADNADCEESLFANPGLLDLAMPALWEAQGEREYVFFTPIGPTGVPVGGSAVRVPAGGTGLPMPGASPRSGLPATMPNSAPRVGGDTLSPSTYHEVETLKFIERVRVQVGSRRIDAWLIEMNDDVGPIYVDDDGVVVRIDLPPVEKGVERYLRRLWPSEF